MHWHKYEFAKYKKVRKVLIGSKKNQSWIMVASEPKGMKSYIESISCRLDNLILDVWHEKSRATKYRKNMTQRDNVQFLIGKIGSLEKLSLLSIFPREGSEPGNIDINTWKKEMLWRNSNKILSEERLSWHYRNGSYQELISQHTHETWKTQTCDCMLVIITIIALKSWDSRGI